MCQAYAAEARVESWLEDGATIRGWIAHRDGMPRAANGAGRHQKNWLHGYDCRKQKLVPWCIERQWREKRTEETGIANFETPTAQQADSIV